MATVTEVNMTQIQAYESMSKEALLEHHLHTLQQHADDMDMLSKELASKSLAVPTNAEPVVMGYGDVAVGGAIRGDDGTPGIIYLRLPEVREHNADCSDIYPVGRAAPDDSVLACIYFGSSEVLQQTIDVLLKLQREHYPIPQPGVLTILNEKTLADWLAEAPSSWDEEYRSIWAKLQVAEAKAAQYRKQWRSAVAARVVNDQCTGCTCPSGNGSLRWPCPVHPPATDNLTKSSNQQVDHLPKDEWIKQCAKRFMARACTPKDAALEMAESCHSNMGNNYVKPRDAADEEMSYWDE